MGKNEARSGSPAQGRRARIRNLDSHLSLVQNGINIATVFQLRCSDILQCFADCGRKESCSIAEKQFIMTRQKGGNECLGCIPFIQIIKVLHFSLSPHMTFVNSSL